MMVDDLVKEHKAYEMERGRKREIKTVTSNWNDTSDFDEEDFGLHA
jgi:hypothetical protein